ncbi:MAG TPA: aminoglycoside phosphotransferase [Candidatus Binatia bacterium]|nr:aminoglycoside phosphotransferase [Candidatus Binatia bacterium]
MSTPSPLDEGLAPERLTETLRASGGLDGGRVAEVTVETSRTTLLSTIQRLRLRYDDAAGPATLIRKQPRGDIDATLRGLLAREFGFYTIVAPATPPGGLVRCYGVLGAEDGPRSLLLEDLTDSHTIVSEWPLPPALEQCERIMDTYATFHAHWWDDSRFGDSIGAWGDTSGDFERYRTEFAKRLAGFADRLGDRLPRERLRIYEQLLEAWPRLIARYATHRGLTLVHGDAHVWNAFHPRDPARDTIRLFDWDGWRIDTATDDLAYMMSLHWYPDRRRRYERPLLERYHATLVARGVTGYPFAALWDDYRLSALWQITTPVWQASWRLNPAVWWSHLERAMLTVDDLDCRALLG